jgi:ribosomal protein L24p/L26e, archaeal/eukaryotic
MAATRSSKARVQRRTQFNAPVHVKRKMCSAHLSIELREKYGSRSVRVCRGDTVAVLRGNEDIRGTEGKVVDVMVDTGRITIEGITMNQADGTAVARPIHASNVVITKLNLNDEWRKDSITKKAAAEEPKKAAPKAPAKKAEPKADAEAKPKKAPAKKKEAKE